MEALSSRATGKHFQTRKLIGNAAYGLELYSFCFRHTRRLKPGCGNFYVWKCLLVALLDNASILLCENQKFNMFRKPTPTKTHSAL